MEEARRKPAGDEQDSITGVSRYPTPVSCLTDTPVRHRQFSPAKEYFMMVCDAQFSSAHRPATIAFTRDLANRLYFH